MTQAEFSLAAFAQTLNDTAGDDYANAKSFRTFKPPDGQYTIMITKIDGQQVAAKKGKEAYSNLFVLGQIYGHTDPDLNGQTVMVGRYTTLALGFLKDDAAVLNGGSPPETLKETVELLGRMVNRFIIWEYEGPKGESKYDSTRIVKLNPANNTTTAEACGETVQPEGDTP
jgi:hypothetical protein